MAEKIELEVVERGNGSRTIKRNIEDVGKAAKDATSNVDYLRRAIETIGFVTVVREAVEMLDALTTMQNRLRAAGTAVESLDAVQRSLVKTSNETRQALTTTAALYSRLAINSKNLGLSQQDLVGFTKSVNQAIILSGANSQEASAGLIQFSQALSSGVLRGDEMRSVLEQLPVVADVIAEKMGVTRGALRSLGAEGQVTAEVIIAAFQEAAADLDKRFQNTVPTISQSFVILKNNSMQMLSDMDKTNGLVSIISGSVIGLSNNLQGLTSIIVGVGTAGAAFYVLTGGITAASGAMAKLSAAVAANPITAVVAAVAGTVVGLTLYSDKIEASADGTVKFSDVITATRNLLMGYRQEIDNAGNVLTKLGDETIETAKKTSFLGSIMEHMVQFYSPMAGLMARAGAIQREEADKIKLGNEKSKKSYDDLNNAVTKVVETYDTAASNTAKLAQVKNTLWQAVGVGIISQQRMNELLGMASAQIYKGKDAYLELLKTYDKVFEANVKLAEAMKTLNAAQRSGRADAMERARVEELVRHELEEALNPQNALIRQYDERASALYSIAEAHRVLSAAVARGSMTEEQAAETLGKITMSLNDQLNPIDKLRQQFDQQYAAIVKLSDAQLILDSAYANGRITQEKYHQMTQQIAESLRDQIDPLGAVSRELTQETELMRMNARERENVKMLLDVEQNLRRQGVVVTDAQRQSLEDLIATYKDEERVAQIRDTIMAETVGKNDEFAISLDVLKAALNDFSMTYQQSLSYILSANSDLFSGTVGELELLVLKHEEMYAQIQALRDADLISAEVAASALQKLEAERIEKRLSAHSQFYGALSSLSKSGNKKLFLIGKAAAVAQATIDGFAAVQKALASTPPPMNYALATALAVQTGANIAQIVSQELPGYAFGGDFKVGGVGGTDSQTVAFRATPGERVQVTTPQQERDRERGSSGSNQTLGMKIINVLDPSVVGDYMGTAEGEQVIMNFIQRNAPAVKSILG